jgi:cellulose synthase/poly-beta-1,6-N-acetylglucosamine synthase-like glycosyltransferase/peptidoglycan/xylan/chitin deacetylase (PgdA/CDA1 family)
MALWVRTGNNGEEAPQRPRRLRPRPRFVLAAILLVLLVNLLFVEAYVNARFAPDQERAAAVGKRSVPARVREGGPIVHTGDGGVRSYQMPARRIALTFDDGPDPEWTPRIMRVLREHDVQATFFVVGSQVARHPELTRQLVADGHELGVHSFTHPRLADLPGWRRRMEYAQTQMAIAHATGSRTPLLRLPYSSGVDSLDDPNWSLVTEAGRLGYLSVFSDTDSRDWAKPGTDAIVRNSIPDGGEGAVVLLHDAGGDRSQTVAALSRLIPQLKRQGYRFTTVSEGYREAASARAGAPGPVAAPATSKWRGTALVWAVQVADATWKVHWALLLLVGALTLARTVLLFAYAVRHARRRRSPAWSWGAPVTEPVSVLVPAHNEKEGIAGTVRSLAASDHPVEVVVVDDASTDGTAGIVRDLNLPNVRVVRVPWGGKAAALNTGIGLSRHNLVVMVDGDTVVEPDAIRRLVQPFADPSVGAVAGNVKVGNRTSMVARWQHIEYVIGFNLDRRLYETFDCIPTVPGALGAFRRLALEGAGGVSDETLAEDTDLTMAVHRAGWRVVYEETARAWTEAPATVRQLWRQRYRWSFGTMQALWKHRRAIHDPGRPGRFGRRGIPVLTLFTVVLPLLAPLVDILAIYGLAFLNRTETVAAWLVVMLLQVITAILAFRLDGERLRPLWALPLQQVAYRQLMYLVLLHSMVTALIGGRLYWQKLRRTGQAAQSAPGLRT